MSVNTSSSLNRNRSKDNLSTANDLARYLHEDDPNTLNPHVNENKKSSKTNFPRTDIKCSKLNETIQRKLISTEDSSCPCLKKFIQTIKLSSPINKSKEQLHEIVLAKKTISGNLKARQDLNNKIHPLTDRKLSDMIDLEATSDGKISDEHQKLTGAVRSISESIKLPRPTISNYNLKTNRSKKSSTKNSDKKESKDTEKNDDWCNMDWKIDWSGCGFASESDETTDEPKTNGSESAKKPDPVSADTDESVDSDDDSHSGNEEEKLKPEKAIEKEKEKKMDDMQNELNRLKKEKANLEQQLKNAQKKIEPKEEGRLKKEIEKANMEAKKLQKELDEMKKENVNLQKQIDDLKHEIKSPGMNKQSDSAFKKSGNTGKKVLHKVLEDILPQLREILENRKPAQVNHADEEPIIYRPNRSEKQKYKILLIKDAKDPKSSESVKYKIKHASLDDPTDESDCEECDDDCEELLCEPRSSKEKEFYYKNSSGKWKRIPRKYIEEFLKNMEIKKPRQTN